MKVREFMKTFLGQNTPYVVFKGDERIQDFNDFEVLTVTTCDCEDELGKHYPALKINVGERSVSSHGKIK